MGMTVRDTTMLYLSQMMGKPVVDANGEKIFVAMAEGIALYGLIISFMILGKL